MGHPKVAKSMGIDDASYYRGLGARDSYPGGIPEETYGPNNAPLVLQVFPDTDLTKRTHFDVVQWFANFVKTSAKDGLSQGLINADNVRDVLVSYNKATQYRGGQGKLISAEALLRKAGNAGKEAIAVLIEERAKQLAAGGAGPPPGGGGPRRQISKAAVKINKAVAEDPRRQISKRAVRINKAVAEAATRPMDLAAEAKGFATAPASKVAVAAKAGVAKTSKRVDLEMNRQGRSNLEAALPGKTVRVHPSGRMVLEKIRRSRRAAGAQILRRKVRPTQGALLRLPRRHLPKCLDREAARARRVVRHLSRKAARAQPAVRHLSRKAGSHPGEALCRRGATRPRAGSTAATKARSTSH
jgi:hypothetical protein